MSKHLEYLYWYDSEGVLQYRIGGPKEIMAACAYYDQALYYCYGEAYQFQSPWYRLNSQYGVDIVFPNETHVPAEIRATHMLIYRG